jgi:hypothetical protein
MTDSITNNMRQKARAGARAITLEEYQDLCRRLDDLQGTAASIQILVQRVTDMEDFEPPLVRDLRATDRGIAKTSGSLSTTVLRLDDQVKRIEAATKEVFEQQVTHIRKMAAAVCLLCNLPGTVGLLLLAWKLGYL